MVCSMSIVLRKILPSCHFSLSFLSSWPSLVEDLALDDAYTQPQLIRLSYSFLQWLHLQHLWNFVLSVSAQPSFETPSHRNCERTSMKWLYFRKPLREFCCPFLLPTWFPCWNGQWKTVNSHFLLAMFNRLDKEHLCLWPPAKQLTNNLLNSWNEVIVFGGNFRTIL